ncbi:hypothetical protein CMK14_20335, partial [Candidatus Poribacteria bacterium]|nr:hypothetical protein [Candidatus Poribacteria bacterium]
AVTATFGGPHLVPSGSGLSAGWTDRLQLIPTYQPEDGPFWPLFFARHHSGSPLSVVFTPDYQSSLPWLLSALRPLLQLPDLTFHQSSAKDRFSSIT